MKKFCNFIIIENKKEFLEHWNNDSKTYDGYCIRKEHTSPALNFEDLAFPLALEYIPYYCGDYVLTRKHYLVMSIEEVLNHIFNTLDISIEKAKKQKKEFKKFKKMLDNDID